MRTARHNVLTRTGQDIGDQVILGVNDELLASALVIDHEELVGMCLRLRSRLDRGEHQWMPALPELLTDEVQALIDQLVGGWDFELAAGLALTMSDELRVWSVLYSRALDPARAWSSPRLMHMGPIAPEQLALQQAA